MDKELTMAGVYSFKTVSCVIHAQDNVATVLEPAIEFARQNDAHLSVLAIGIDATDPGFYYAGAEALALAENAYMAREETAALETAARTRLERVEFPFDLRAVTLQSAAVTDFVARSMRFSDVVILRQPYVADAKPWDVIIAEAVLFGAGVPVIIVPPGATLRTDPNVLLAWDDGDPALHAARAAVAAMQGARSVSITIVEPSRHAPDRSDPGGALAQFLVRHGIRAEIQVLARSEPRIADILNRRVREQGCDMVVMGAYGHSRVKEAVFGGATRHMLETCKVPIFMRH